jgi:hypothetical protein
METLADPQTLTNRLVEVAPLSDKITTIGQADDGTWVLEFSGKTIVLMEWASQPERIVLTAPLGTPMKDHEHELFTVALSFSALSNESCGARMALGGDGGELMLIRELHGDTAGGWDLLPVLEHFAYVAGWWQEVISRPVPPQETNQDMSGMLLRA